MSWSYFIYSTLSPSEALKLEDLYSREFSAFLEEHPEIAEGDESTGFVFVNKSVPTVDDVVETNALFDIEVPGHLLDRLKRCQSTIEIESPVPPESSRLQVSTLSFLLERAQEGLMDWGDHQLQLSEDALRRLKKFRNFGVMGQPKAPVPAPKARTVPSEEERRSHHLVHLFHLAEDDTSLALDLQRLLTRQQEVIQRYAAHLFQHGPISDADAAKALGIKRNELAPLLTALDAKLKELTDE